MLPVLIRFPRLSDVLVRTALVALTLIVGISPAWTQIRQAEKEMELFNYTGAVGLLSRAWEKRDPVEEPRISGLLALCYRKMNDWPNALTWYRRWVETGNAPSEAYYFLALSLRNTGDYQEAKRYFLLSDSLNPSDPAARTLAACCDSALCWMAGKATFEVQRMESLNSSQSEFGCVWGPEGLVFTSDRYAATQHGKRYGWTGNAYLRLFLAVPNAETLAGTAEFPEVITPSAFSPPTPCPGLSDKRWHDGPASFDPSTRTAYINRTVITGERGTRDPLKIQTHLLKIYTCAWGEKGWGAPEPFFLNDPSHSVGHPAISPDGTRLFFVSDKPEGYGGTDLYVCSLRNGTWGEAVNLGPGVNTPGNEMFPFITGSGDLWFASDSHPGFGGLDLFVSHHQEGVWTTPVNPGYPLNSSWDDFSLCTGATGQTGFFSSNRPGGKGGDDIYLFRRIPDEGLLAQGTEPEINPDTNATPHHQTTAPPHQVTTPVSPVPGYELNRPYILENIYYDFDRWEIREDAKPALDSLVRIMKSHPVCIELGSHTDCRGTDEYNLALSQHRAESAVRYIIAQGIDPGRITARGYGETQLLNRCGCREGDPCPEAEHQQNRRTEFRILSRTD